LVVFLCLLAVPVIARADISTTIYSIRDGTIYSDSAGNDALRTDGASAVFLAGTVGAATGTHAGSANASRRGLIAFNTGAIPSNATITGATVWMHVTYSCCSGGQDSDRTIGLYRISGAYPWNESSNLSTPGDGLPTNFYEPTWCTWSYGCSPACSWTCGGGWDHFSGSTTVGGFGWYAWSGSTITSDVQQWVNGSHANTGWLVYNYSEGTPLTMRHFSSREDGSYPPHIDVTYRMPQGWSGCSSGDQCTTGYCTDGVCCNTGGCGGATECAQAGYCAAGSGTCYYAPIGYGTGCSDDGNVCTIDICDGGGSCSHPAGNAGTQCRGSAGVCDPAEYCDGSTPSCPGDSKYGGGTQCRASAGVCDPAEYCDGSSNGCPPDARAASGTACADDGLECTLDQCDGSGVGCTHPNKSNGSPCSNDGNPCTTDQCLAGVCDHAAPAPANTVCRASLGPCDPQETCNGAKTCPGDAKSTAVCRAAAGPCDTAESCDGVNPTCPADRFLSGNSCRAESCDPGTNQVTLPATCTGSSAQCPAVETVSCGSNSCSGKICGGGCTTDSGCASTEFCAGGVCTAKKGNGAACSGASQCTSGNCVDGVCCNTACAGGLGDCQACNVSGHVGTCYPEPNTFVCRPASGTCDADEKCNGSSTTCPADVKRPATFVCRPSAGPCDVADKCDGTTGACPADAKVATTTVCRAAAGVCDLDDHCDGVSDACPTDAKKPVGTACADDGLPCTSDVCSGTGNTCTHPPGNAGTVCRATAGACDVAETCDGANSTCPQNQYAPASTICVATSCSAGKQTSASSCTGSSVSCPAAKTQGCGLYACGATACLTTCSKDGDCALTAFCNAGVCQSKRANGVSCKNLGNSACTSGFCVDGVCCNSACSGQCQACDVATSVGTCTPVVGKPHGSRPACNTDGSVCAGTCDGTVATGCSYPGQSTECRTPSCSANTASLAAYCDGAGTCPASQTQPCAPFLCGPTECAGNCKTDDDCASTARCAGGVCVTKSPDGTPCSTGDTCASHECVDGVCCHTDCKGQCEACDEPGQAGTCVPVSGVPRGNRAACAGSGDCVGSCDGQNAASCAYPGSGTTCRQPACEKGRATLGAFCNGAGECPPEEDLDCASASCQGALCAPSDQQPSCASDADCSGVTEYCAAGVCVPKKDNGAHCNTANECSSSYCVDGLCCNAYCVGQCEACDVAGSEGTCTPVTGPPHGSRRACATEDPDCGGQCDGTNRNGCTYPGAEKSCRTASCANGTATLAATCQGDGSCGPIQKQACDPVKGCDKSGATCDGGCSILVGNTCASTEFCSGGICLAKLAQGKVCGSDAQCATGHCVDGVCCDTPCDGQCEACDQTTPGTCSAVSGAPRGGRPACAGFGVCAGTCDGQTRGSCTMPGASQACGVSSCAGSLEVQAATCNPNGFCDVPGVSDCAPFACDTASGACLTGCGSDGDCTPPFVCRNAACVLGSRPDGGDAGSAAPDAGRDAAAGNAGSGGGGRAGTDAGAGGATGGSGPSGRAGSDAGFAVDAGRDAGTAKPPRKSRDTGGCGCRISEDRETQSGPGLLSALALAVLWARKRRRAPHTSIE
jgi:hypothetical protein